MNEENVNKEKKTMELKIYNQDDRLNVAQILIKNGYTVSQTKRKKSESSKSVNYYLIVSIDEGNADTTR